MAANAAEEEQPACLQRQELVSMLQKARILSGLARNTFKE